MNFQFLFPKVFRLTQLPIRTCATRKGIEYFGFTYYPRTKDFKDPPYEPSKVFLVRRIKSTKGLSPDEKKCLVRLNIDGRKKDNGHINVVKNIPEINALLWTVKHLIEIRPITYKGELPKDSDYDGTHLRLTGELVISPKLKMKPGQLQVTENYHKDKKEFDRFYIREYLKRQWMRGTLF